MLNLRLRNNNINCSLKCNNNYFTTTNSVTSKHFWRGYYKCSKVDCNGEYVAIIDKIENQKSVVINFFVRISPINHKEQEIKFRINGKERENLAKELLIKGTMTVKSENLIYNDQNIKCFQSI